MKTRWIPVLLLPALAGCGAGSDPKPTTGQTPAVQKEKARPDEAADAVKKHLESADVVFEGVLKSTAPANVDRDLKTGIQVHGPPGMVIAAVDPRFLIEVEVRKVRKGDVKEWSGTRCVAIHSLAESFRGGGADAGKPFVFHLWRSQGDAKQYVVLDALPLP